MSEVDTWTLYAEHRRKFTDHIIETARAPGGRLCILGAGNCNDVDLEQLAKVFTEIHLVDLDEKALARAVARQPAEIRHQLFRHAPVNLSGLPQRRLEKWKRVPPAHEEIQAAAKGALDALLGKLPKNFDVVASACILTQMSYALNNALGSNNPAIPAICVGLIVTHLNTLAGLASADGRILFACDLVSSELYPLAQLTSGRDLRLVMQDVMQAGSFYASANPELIFRMLSDLGETALIDPWLWTGPLSRTYLVYGLRVERTNTSI